MTGVPKQSHRSPTPHHQHSLRPEREWAPDLDARTDQLPAESQWQRPPPQPRHEHEHEAITEGLDLGTGMLRGRHAYKAVVLAANPVGGVVTKSLTKLRRPDKVGEHHRNGAGVCGSGIDHHMTSYAGPWEPPNDLRRFSPQSSPANRSTRAAGVRLESPNPVPTPNIPERRRASGPGATLRHFVDSGRVAWSPVRESPGCERDPHVLRRRTSSQGCGCSRERHRFPRSLRPCTPRTRCAPGSERSFFSSARSGWLTTTASSLSWR